MKQNLIKFGTDAGFKVVGTEHAAGRFRWRVLHVVANHEKNVVQHLIARSLENYLPLYTERSRWTDRVVSLQRPLFAGYVFVRFAPDERLLAISTPGVLHLLGERECDTVSEIEIDRIRAGLTSGCLLRPHAGVAVGTPVRVLRGIFEGEEGIVTDLRRECKVVMALAATGQCFLLDIDLEDIEVLHKPAEPPASGQLYKASIRRRAVMRS